MIRKKNRDAPRWRSHWMSIQSAFAVYDTGKTRQEKRSLMNTGDGFKKMIITKDALAPLYNEAGVLVMNVFDFLLKPDSMDIF